jgi:F-type H+-transporting ATPase subunit b
MKTPVLSAAFALAALPAAAASYNPFSPAFWTLSNSNFVVLVAFLIFIGILIYYKVPAAVGGLLDKRAATIRAELDEARALREEAQTVLANFQRMQDEVKGQAERIVQQARSEAEAAATQAKADLERTIARRLKAAEEQIASAEAAALRDVKDRAAQIAVAAAGDLIARSMSAKDAGRLVDDAIATVEAKLH